MSWPNCSLMVVGHLGWGQGGLGRERRAVLVVAVHSPFGMAGVAVLLPAAGNENRRARAHAAQRESDAK